MAAPVYSTDLATTSADTTKGTIYRQDSTSALTTTGCLGTLTWGEPTGSTAGGIPTYDTDYFILGVATADKTFNATSVGGLGVGTTNAASLPTDGAFFFWSMFTCPNSISNQTGGGIQVLIGSTLANYYRYYVGGDDTHPYGGWRCYPVNPAAAASATYGAPTSTRQYFGIAYNVDNAVAKGQPAACGGIRFGRGYLLCINGETGNYATFAGASTFNDYNDGTNGWNRLGLVQVEGGTYKLQGLFQMGSAATAVDFRDSNKNLVIANTEFVTSNFNTFEVINASSRVDWTNISIIALGTVSRGNFVATDNATINLINCVFTGMGTFTFQSNSTISGCTFRSCNLITRGNSAIISCIFETTNDSVKALLLRDPTRSLTGCTFTAPASGNTKHAIEITEAGTYTFTNNTFTNYATSNGSVGTEVIYNNSSGIVTIQHSGTTGTISYMNQGTSTTFVTGSVAITITVKDEADANINGAFVYIVDGGSVEVMNTTTASGQATGSYTGAYSSGTLRVRYYGYKPYTGSVSLSTTVNQTIVLIADPVQDASPQNLSSYYTINTTAKTITSVGTATYSVKEYFKWLANTFAAASYMDDPFPLMADTATVFRFTNSWTFGTPTTDYKYLNGGAITSSDSAKVWSNIYTIGTLVSGTTVDVYQNDTQLTPWWSSGHIDILVLVKDTTIIDSSNITILARLYSTLYDHTIVSVPSGRNPAPLAAFNDTNNQTVEGTVGASPYTNITITFGYYSGDLSNGDGPQPYDVSINCATLPLTQVYEYLKYVTRTGSSTTLNGVNGEYYQTVGDIRFTYSGASGGVGYFTQTSAITDTITSATGYIVSETHSGATGTLVIRNTHGTFSNGDTISSGSVTATISSVPSVIDKNKQAPFGSFAGGSFFGARGVWIYNMAVADTKKYQLIDSASTPRYPPNVVPISILVKDQAGANIENAQVAVYKTSDMSEILNTATNSSGIAQTTFTYASDVPVTIRVRKSSAVPKYVPVETSGTITSTGLSVTVTFISDANAAATTNGTIASSFTINTTLDTITHTGTTKYSMNELYTYLMDFFDDSAQMAHSVPMSAQTLVEYTLTNGWLTDHTTINYLYGGSLQTSGLTDSVYVLYMSGTPTNPVPTDIGKTVQNTGATHTGILLDYTDTAPYRWYVRAVLGVFTAPEAVTIPTGVGAGTTSSVLTGEGTWSNIYTLGSIVSGTTLDVYQNDTQITPWWSSGHIDILVRVKIAGVEIDNGNVTVLARKYSTLYDHFLIDASTGRNPVPLAAFADVNNETAETGTFDTIPYTTITFSFGAKSRDLGNGNGFKPYDVEIDCKGQTIAHIYEYLKYVTRTGSSTTLNGVDGEYYTGVGDIRFNYSGASGSFTETTAITNTTTNATGYIVSKIDLGGNTGTLVIRNTHGTFANTNAISSGGVTATISTVPTTITQSKQAPFGTFAGGQFFGAQGVYIFNMAETDINNYELIDSTGTTQTPPTIVNTIITVQDLTTGLDLEAANVLVWVTNSDNYFYQAPVSITGSGTTATVTHTAHGMITGDYVIIKGVTNDDDYNGVFQITKSNDNQYTYTATETLGASPATGASITATFAIINSATNASGVVIDSRSFPINQPVAGWARKSSGIPYYQQGTISGTIDSNTGLSIIIQLARDE